MRRAFRPFAGSGPRETEQQGSFSQKRRTGRVYHCRRATLDVNRCRAPFYGAGISTVTWSGLVGSETSVLGGFAILGSLLNGTWACPTSDSV